MAIGQVNSTLQRKPFLSETTGVKAAAPTSIFNGPTPTVETSGTVASVFSGGGSCGSSGGSSGGGAGLSCVA